MRLTSAARTVEWTLARFCLGGGHVKDLKVVWGFPSCLQRHVLIGCGSGLGQ